MKRAVDLILEELSECDRVVKQKKNERASLKEELAAHPEIIEKQLCAWHVPKKVQGNLKVEELLVEYDSCADADTVAAGTCRIEREDWIFGVQIETKKYDYCASRWTGQEWECDGFAKLDEVEAEENEDKWKLAMGENAHEECPVASSIISLAFHEILQNGEECVINLQ